jgi:hypothetical protein
VVVGTEARPGYFSAEQVNALALVIDNVARSAGFIIGDRKGVGKGRFLAATLARARAWCRPPPRSASPACC